MTVACPRCGYGVTIYKCMSDRLDGTIVEIRTCAACWEDFSEVVARDEDEEDII